MITDTGV